MRITQNHPRMGPSLSTGSDGPVLSSATQSTLYWCALCTGSCRIARSRSHCQGPSSHPPGSGAPFLRTTSSSVGKLEQRSPTRVHSSFQGEHGGGALYSKSGDTLRQGRRPGGPSPKPARDARHTPTPRSGTPASTSPGTTPAWIFLIRPDRAQLVSAAHYVGDMLSHPQKVPWPLFP